MGSLEVIVMVNNSSDVQGIKGIKYLTSAYWIGMIWTVFGIITIVYSHAILYFGLNPFLSIPPFNVKSAFATALLIFPGMIILGLASCIIQKNQKKPLSQLVHYFLLTTVLATIFIIMILVGIKLFSHN